VSQWIVATLCLAAAVPVYKVTHRFSTWIVARFELHDEDRS
jgi:hypothetical protein